MPAGPLDNTPASPGYDTDVLIAGSGPAGGSMALLLATYGVRVQMITKYGQLADTPRAHITNQRTVEVFRDLGIEHLLQPGRPGTGPCSVLGNQPTPPR